MTITFSVPVKEKILIKQGQEVDFTTPVSKKGNQEQKIIPLAALLKISPQKIFLFLKKFVGEEITRGELLAEKKGVLDSKQYFSEYDGTINEIDHEKGNLVITTQSATKEILHAYFTGKVDGVKKNEVTLEVGDFKNFEVKDVTKDFGGETLVIEEDKMNTFTPEQVKNRVVLADMLKPYDQSKLEVMGAVGFISDQELADKTPPPFARVKTKETWEEIKKLKLPYCLVDKKTSTLYFYQSS